MAGALIGEAFLAASIQTLCERIASGDFMALFRGKKPDHSLLEKLETTLLTIHAVLNDAEEKQIVNPAVGKWLAALKFAVFDADDLLDEIDTGALRCKVEAEYQTKKTQVRTFLSTSLNPFDQGMNGRIQELFQRLEHLAKQKNHLGLREGVGAKVSQRTPTSSVVENDFCTYGRDGDKEKLKTLLLSDDASSSKISVIPIVGMGGVGKTTLAQIVYNDDSMKEHFDIQAWVCISEEFDAVRVTKTLLESITEKPCNILDMSSLEVKLRGQVMGKKFLFVLDDLWNADYDDWVRLRNPITFGARGSKVIVTTRHKSVASTVHTVPIYYLEQLSHDDCWLLLAKHAFRNENPSAHQDLEEIGKKIARRCDGLPLAAKTLGGVLSCNMDYKEWDVILNSNLWDLPHANNILPSLRLSYHYLPSYLKQCFSYCSIFPKDYEFKKEDVIRLWAAEGLIPQAGSEKGMEEVGERYFNELLSRSLLQRSREGESSFTMHDLINDLAMSVSRDFSFRMDEGGSCIVPKTIRHVSYMRGTIYDIASKFEPLNGINLLRTFLPVSLRPDMGRYDVHYVSSKVPDVLLPTQKCLRVLSLSGYKNITHLPDCIGNHIHLRYIDLSYTAIEKLPDTVCTLYNLQTLLLLGCSSLTELPVEMRKLINLRHLDINGIPIKEMPEEMGRLNSLRTLSRFVLGKSSGSSIGELRELTHLGGKLYISNMQNVADALDASRANLKDKKGLTELGFAWGHEHADDSQKERDVLDRLQPSFNLVKLTVRHYGGTRFPNWLGDSSFSKIQVMRLSDCNNCWSLPSVGQLPALKELCVERMKSVERIGAEFYGSNEYSLIQPFQSLEKLEFEEMPEWEEWLPSPRGGQCTDFPRLEKLVLTRCPKLRGSLPNHLPCLKILDVSGCEVLDERALDHIENLQQTLEELRIAGCPLSLLGMDMMHNNNIHLKILVLGHFPSLLSFPKNGLPATLTSLYIHNCRSLEFLTHEMMTKLTSLKEFHLSHSCDSLRSFPMGIFPKLSLLEIQGCENLESLSIEEGIDENLSHLSNLFISNCPNLMAFPQEGLPTPKLSSFSVEKCENLKLLPGHMHTLTALRALTIWNLPNLESFAQGGLPPNLQYFRIEHCDRVRPLVEWGLQGLVSLEFFEIWKSDDMLETLLKKQLLPPTLQALDISELSSLESLDGKGLQHLTSLQTLHISSLSLKYLDGEALKHLTSLRNLEITSCPSLESLQKEGLPASLTFLRIEDCSCLKKGYQNKRGEDWAKIAHIPCIEIDEQVII